jgi:hypothetical protein
LKVLFEQVQKFPQKLSVPIRKYWKPAIGQINGFILFFITFPILTTF